MTDMDKILEVRNLVINFRTSSGAVKAVRDVSFDLERGKTLAIVGESGSGKSVTARAAIGILAGNGIVENGEILYDGKDILKLPEEEMYKLRGDKIAMVFQDPLSALNPIIKTGRQLTEAMLLKNKAKRRSAGTEFRDLLSTLKESAKAIDPGNKDEINALCKTFDDLTIRGTKLETAYNTRKANAMELSSLIKDFLFKAEKNVKQDVKTALRDFARRLEKVDGDYYTVYYSDKIAALKTELTEARAAAKSGNGLPEQNVKDSLEKVVSLLDEIEARKAPDFYAAGFYMLKGNSFEFKGESIEEMNEKVRSYMDANFSNEFLQVVREGVEYSYRKALEEKKRVLPLLEEKKNWFLGSYDKKEALSVQSALADEVERSIDRLEFIKDSNAYTFRSSLKAAIEKYFRYEKQNPKEEARFSKQSAKREKLVAKGKSVDWKVVPANVRDLDDLKENTSLILEELAEKYRQYIADAEKIDFDKRSAALIDHLKECASDSVYKVTRSMAKERAIKLLDEVGIHDSRAMYNRYPFEFSGGMRQRVVIAIALAADPDILICDEPTTALDVTIQSQILELINRLKAERNLSVIFITHDLGVVANMADDIAVMYAGKIIEYGTADDIFYDPRHPYTWALLSSMPDLETNEKLEAIPGTPPNMIYPPVGDAFAARNKYALDIDFEMQPPMFEISPTHKAATWLLHPDAPKVDVPKAITDRIERMKKEMQNNG